MIFFIYWLLACIFLCSTIALTALQSFFRSTPRGEAQKLFDEIGSRFFYRIIHDKHLGGDAHQGLFFAATTALHISRTLYTALIVVALLFTPLNTLEKAVLIAILFYFSFLVSECIPRIAGTSYPARTCALCCWPASVLMTLALPITYPFLKLTRALPQHLHFDYLHEPDTHVKQEIIEIIQEAEITEQLDANEKKLLASLLSFCEHLTREVMVPRVDLFCLEASTPIRDAIEQLEYEGYSRIPIYEENIDQIVGILLYKDLLATYRKYVEADNDSALLDAPISSIQKPPIYTPETKKISDLLQEFRKKQTHMAIVVDEYGGTEGIVTIEDILEDIVGEIIDESDVEEELNIAQSDGAWIVDPRMSLLDADERLNIKIPQEGDYDTIGGYVFHCAGEIPQRGFTISSDAFDLEVLRCNDRTIEKVRIRPTQKTGETPPKPEV